MKDKGTIKQVQMIFLFILFCSFPISVRVLSDSYVSYLKYQSVMHDYLFLQAPRDKKMFDPIIGDLMGMEPVRENDQNVKSGL